MAERKKGKGSRRSRHEWQSLLAKLDGSGLGVEAFCRREAISAASLYRWRALLSDGGDGGEAVVSNRVPAFVDLGTLNSASSSRLRIELKLDLGDGLVLHLGRG
jgi:transposase-like protein